MKRNKSPVIIFILFIFGINIISAQSNLELANHYYDNDDYPNAVEYFKKTIFNDKQYNGTILYRFSYSMEQTNYSITEYAPYYSAAAYLFENAKETNNNYYLKAITKEKKLGLSHDDFSDDKIKQLFNLETQDSNSSISSNYFDKIIQYAENNITKEILIVVGIIIILIYIIGRIFSNKTECVIFSSFKEILLLFAPCFVIILLLVFIIGAIEIDGNLAFILMIVSFVISFISAIVFSIYENLGTRKPVLYTIISIITKLTLFIIAPIILLLSTTVMTKSKKDKRYKDGTKNNQKTKNITIAISVLSGLVFSLIKTPKRKLDSDNIYN